MPPTWDQKACEVLLKRPDPNNWSTGNVENEVDKLIDNTPWWKIYDLAERLYVAVGKDDFAGANRPTMSVGSTACSASRASDGRWRTA
jgi:hypothetical protein